jgi:hypothetical protein
LVYILKRPNQTPYALSLAIDPYHPTNPSDPYPPISLMEPLRSSCIYQH